MVVADEEIVTGPAAGALEYVWWLGYIALVTISIWFFVWKRGRSTEEVLEEFSLGDEDKGL